MALIHSHRRESGGGQGHHKALLVRPHRPEEGARPTPNVLGEFKERQEN